MGWLRVASTLIWVWGCVAGDKGIVFNQSPTVSQETKWCQNLLSYPIASENGLFHLVLRATLAWVLSCFTWVPLFVTLWTVACQAPLSMGFSRQEHWSGLPCPPPEHLLDLGIEPESLNSSWIDRSALTASTTLLLLLSCSVVSDFATPGLHAAHQASLSFTVPWSLLKLMSIESMMLSNHFILCPLSSSHALNLSQHQDLFQWVSSSHQVAKALELQFQHQCFHWIFRVDFL